MKKKSIKIIGWYNHSNCGDETFKLVHAQIFNHPKFRGVDIEWVNEASSTSYDDSIVVLGAGDVVKPFYVDKIPDHVNFHLYGTGFSNSKDLEYAESLKHRIKSAWMRSQEDAIALQHRNFPAHYTPDIVFNLDNVSLAKSNSKLEGSRVKKQVVCFLSNNAMQSSLFLRNLSAYNLEMSRKLHIANVLEKLSNYYDIVLVPMSHDWNDFDLSFCCDVYSLMDNREAVGIIEEKLGFSQVISLIQNSDLVISMKFHGAVFACLANVPFVNIASNRKNRLFCEENGFADVFVDENDFSENSLISAIKVAEYPPFKERLTVARQHLVADAKRQASRFVDLLVEEL